MRIQQIPPADRVSLAGHTGAPWMRRSVLTFSLLWAALPLLHACVYVYHYLFYCRDSQLDTDGIASEVFYLTYRGNTFPWLYYLLGFLTVLLAGTLLANDFRTREDWNSLPKKSPWSLLLLGMLFWSVLATILSIDRTTSLQGTFYRQDGLRSYVIYAAVYLCGVYLDRRCSLYVLRTFVVISNLDALIFYGQTFRLPFFRQVFTDNSSSTFINSNHYAYYLTMSILLLAGLYLYDRGRLRGWLYLLSLCVQTHVLILNDTLGCFLAVLPGMAALCLFWCWSGRKLTVRIFIPAALFLAVTMLVCWNPMGFQHSGRLLLDLGIMRNDFTTMMETPDAVDESSSGRIRILLWKRSLKLIMKRPLFGYGPDVTSLLIINERPHNEYLQHALYLGVPALLMYLAALVSLAWRRWMELPRLDEPTLIAAGAVVGYLASAFFGVTIFHVMPLFFLLLGMVAARISDTGEPARPVKNGAAEKRKPPKTEAQNS